LFLLNSRIPLVSNSSKLEVNENNLHNWNQPVAQNWYQQRTTFPSSLIDTNLKLQTNPNKLPSFHLSQPFSLSYRSILPTSLTYVMLLRHQRLLTLRTWCGYRYEMVWKWITTHYFSWNN